MNETEQPGTLEVRLSDQLGALVERLLRYSDIRRNDPRENREALRDLILSELRDALADTERAVREAMVADGWRKTRYAAPVTECEACLTPDACSIRGQCGHYLRERA